MDSPEQPKAPDPYATANAQGQANSIAASQTTNLNRPDQYTPYGSQTWSKSGGRTFDQTGYDAAMASYRAGAGGAGGAGGAAGGGSGVAAFDGNEENVANYGGGTGMERYWDPNLQQAFIRPEGSGGAGGAGGAGGTAPNIEDFYSGSTGDERWASHITLDPRVQAILDSQLATSQGLESSIQGALGRVTNTLKDPIDYAGLPQAGNYDDALATAKGNYTDISGNVEQAASGSLSAQQLAQQQTERLKALYGTDFNYDSLGDAPQANQAVRQQVEDAYYNREKSRLDPRFATEENRLRTDLMNRGLTEGSAAWGARGEEFGRMKNDAYGLASDNAILKGGEEMQRLFGMEMASRQQGVGELDKLRAMPTQEAAAAAALAGGATSGLTSLAGTQGAQNAGIASNTASEMQMRDTQRQSNLAEQERKRALVLNELASLRSGAQVNMPQFASGASGSTVGAAPVAQSAYNSYQGQMGAYNGEVASNNNTMSAAATLGAAAMALPALAAF